MRTAVLLLALAAFSPEPWQEDFRHVLTEIASHYANLDSAIDDRRVDLAAIRKTAEERIRNAKNDAEAQEAIDWFLRQFGDGHVLMRWNANAPQTADAATPQPLCQRLGYARKEPGGIDFASSGQYTPLEGDDATDFPAGILRLAGGRKIGVLRIHLFSETAHPELCAAAQKQLALANDATCEGLCEPRLQLATANLLTAALERRVAALRAAGATALVVDITGNGGGSNWVEPAARVLTPVALRSPRMAFLQHDHWRKQLRQRLDDVQLDLDAKRDPQSLVTQAAGTLRAAIARADGSCDRSGVWNDPPKRPDCSLVVGGFLYATGVLPYAKPGALPESIVSRHTIFLPSQYDYHEGVNRLPLYVLVDAGTGSAAEYFAAMMKDNGAATIIGTPTGGSGCGYTNGGIRAKLPNSGGELRLPDCIRLRADGTNEVLSVIPDLLVPWRARDSRYQRAMTTLRALEKSVR
jgi:hypothetical protein